MQITLNGEIKDINSDDMSLVELLAVFDLPEKRIAVELNRQVIRRTDWASTTVAANDKVEVIHFVGGG